MVTIPQRCAFCDFRIHHCEWCGDALACGCRESRLARGLPLDRPTGRVYYGGLRVFIHAGMCSDAVDQCLRIYDRSTRGRWRPNHEVRRLMREHRDLVQAGKS